MNWLFELMRAELSHLTNQSPNVVAINYLGGASETGRTAVDREKVGNRKKPGTAFLPSIRQESKLKGSVHSFQEDSRS